MEEEEEELNCKQQQQKQKKQLRRHRERVWSGQCEWGKPDCLQSAGVLACARTQTALGARRRWPDLEAELESVLSSRLLAFRRTSTGLCANTKRLDAEDVIRRRTTKHKGATNLQCVLVIASLRG